MTYQGNWNTIGEMPITEKSEGLLINYVDDFKQQFDKLKKLPIVVDTEPEPKKIKLTGAVKKQRKITEFMGGGDAEKDGGEGVEVRQKGGSGGKTEEGGGIGVDAIREDNINIKS